MSTQEQDAVSVDIDTLSGRELDYMIADYVLKQAYYDLNAVPNYSTDMTAAWQVWEKLPPERRLHDYGIDAINGRFTVICGNGSYGADGDFQGKFVAHGGTMPEAICRASLKAALNSASVAR